MEKEGNFIVTISKTDKPIVAVRRAVNMDVASGGIPVEENA